MNGQAVKRIARVPGGGLLAGVCLLVSTSLSTVQAAEPRTGLPAPRLAIVPMVAGPGASRGLTEHFTQLVTGELAGRSNLVTLVPIDDGADAAARAREMVIDGRKRLAELEFETAIATLRQALELMITNPSSLDIDQLIEAQLSLAVAWFRTGEDDRARAALETVARLEPEHELKPGFPPVFIREFERAKKRVAAGPHGGVVAEGPKGATLFLDGRELGPLPVTEPRVGLGAHYLRIEGPDGVRGGAVVDVRGPNQRVQLSYSSVPQISAPALLSGVDPAMIDQLAELARVVRADYVLVGVVHRKSPRQLSAGTALFSLGKRGVMPLPSFSLDPELLTAGVEAFKLADVLMKLMAQPVDLAPLPLRLAPGPPPAVAARPTVSAPPSPSPSATLPEGALPEAPRLSPSALPSSSSSSPSPAFASGSPPTWVWIAAGAGLTIAAGAGAYLGIRYASRPVTGTVSATW